jgi:hypothetical protein
MRLKKLVNGSERVAEGHIASGIVYARTVVKDCDTLLPQCKYRRLKIRYRKCHRGTWLIGVVTTRVLPLAAKYIDLDVTAEQPEPGSRFASELESENLRVEPLRFDQIRCKDDDPVELKLDGTAICRSIV